MCWGSRQQTQEIVARTVNEIKRGGIQLIVSWVLAKCDSKLAIPSLHPILKIPLVAFQNQSVELANHMVNQKIISMTTPKETGRQAVQACNRRLFYYD